jgi:hypothetical protein
VNKISAPLDGASNGDEIYIGRRVFAMDETKLGQKTHNIIPKLGCILKTHLEFWQKSSDIRHIPFQ